MPNSSIYTTITNKFGDQMENNCGNFDVETVTHIKNYVATHDDFLKRTLKFGSPLQRAKASLLLKIAGVSL
ncbi:hypothetical protein DU80_14305 [Methanosarcina mazei]|uniref:Uncharacterized protein n=1 Tax=Methanosarcina mazei TaxID=2209 RepID=A0A0F8BUT2_METMZ|nr:hypothetical protein DU47_13930 [Methanosarcina mazei]KKH90481.1 hypothetical protein DU80_14305 [Methanosarcina mazei]BBL64253.1 hypothetical protein MmazTMA_12300 [Methanosarcina mazei]